VPSSPWWLTWLEIQSQLAIQVSKVWAQLELGKKWPGLAIPGESRARQRRLAAAQSSSCFSPQPTSAHAPKFKYLVSVPKFFEVQSNGSNGQEAGDGGYDPDKDEENWKDWAEQDDEASPPAPKELERREELKQLVKVRKAIQFLGEADGAGPIDVITENARDMVNRSLELALCRLPFRVSPKLGAPAS
jgi:hypothetical protein